MQKKKNFLGIREIASLAGVSTATVSRVLNSPQATSEKTRKKVMEIIREYDYVPNMSAKALFSGQSNTIALFVFDMYNPFYISFIKELNLIALEHNYILIICDAADEPEREEKYYNYCKSNRCAGIVYSAGSTRKYVGGNESYNNIPIVIFDRSPFQDANCYSIKSDDDKAMQLLTDYLYKMNHRKIGFIGANDALVSAKERLRSFHKHMNRLGLEVPPHYIKSGNFTVQNGVDAFDYFYPMSDAPTAIIAANDQIAQGFVSRARSLNINIPQEFSVCGIDGVDYDPFYPRITSVKQNIREMAAAAFDFIINADKIPAPATKVIDVTLRIGQTCQKI